jgi:arylsulfatase
MDSRLNILWFHVDNLGLGELGCYGGGKVRGADTTRIDEFARESLQLWHYVAEPQCSPSRAALLTGRHAIRSGTHTAAMGGEAGGIVAWERTLADALSGAAPERLPGKRETRVVEPAGAPVDFVPRRQP